MWRKLALAAGILVYGCTGNTGPSDRGEVRVTLAQRADMATAGVAIPRSAVESLILTITAVEVIRAGISEEETGDQDNFQRLGLPAELRLPIDLLSLPAESPTTPGLLVGAGEIEEGAYDRIRLRFDPNTAGLVLVQPVTVDGVSLPAGSHPVVITTGAQTGVQVGGFEFLVSTNIRTDVELIFDPIQTFSTVRLRGDTVLLVPAFRLGRVDQ